MNRGHLTEKYICDKFLEMMDNKSCFAIKVTELIKYAKISRSTFYVYFDSVNDLVQRLEDEFIAGLPDEKTLSSSRSQEDNTILTSIVNHMKKNMNLLRALCGPYGDPGFHIKMKNRLAKYFLRYYGNNNTRLSNVEKTLILEYISGGRWQMYIWWIDNEDKVSIEEFMKSMQKAIRPITNLFRNK